MVAILKAFFWIWPAAAVAYVIGSVASSQFVISAHQASTSVEITGAERLAMTLFDVSNMWLYLVIIGLGFCVAFPVAFGIKRLLPGLSGLAYPLAGAAAIGAALALMYQGFATVPISGARSELGFAAQVLAGAVGGYAYALFAAERTRARG
ncbi:MAG: hypothetical protein AAF909_02740 [Pseudomonadota bacterium]